MPSYFGLHGCSVLFLSSQKTENEQEGCSVFCILEFVIILDLGFQSLASLPFHKEKKMANWVMRVSRCQVRLRRVRGWPQGNLFFIPIFRNSTRIIPPDFWETQVKAQHEDLNRTSHANVSPCSERVLDVPNAFSFPPDLNFQTQRENPLSKRQLQTLHVLKF